MPRPLVVIGRKRWPGVVLLRHILRDPRPIPTVVVDYRAQGARLFDADLAKLAEAKGVRWASLGQRSCPFRVWHLQDTESDGVSLQYLLAGWAATLGHAPRSLRDAMSALHRIGSDAIASASPRLQDRGGVESPLPVASAAPALALSVVSLTRLLSAHGRSVGEFSRLDAPDTDLTPLVGVLRSALRYPAVFAACSAATPLPLPTSDQDPPLFWLEIPKAEMEHAEWDLLARLAGSAVVSWARRPAPLGADSATRRVVFLYPQHSPGTRFWPDLVPDTTEIAWALARTRSMQPTPSVGKVIQGGARVWVGPGHALEGPFWERSSPDGVRKAAATLEPAQLLACRSAGAGSAWVHETLRIAPVSDTPSPGLALRDNSLVLGEPTRRLHLAETARRATEDSGPLGTPLYAKLSDPAALLRGWNRVRKARADSHGSDGVTVRAFGLRADAEIALLSTHLREGTYRPVPLRRVRLPKPDGGFRTIALMAVRDRVAQAACLEVLEPLIDPSLSDRCYAYRRGRGAPVAIQAVLAAIRHAPHRWAAKCDVHKCFDSIEHDRLLRALWTLAPDPDLLRLVRTWAGAEVLVGDDIMLNEVGVPQGASLSPMLANLYLAPVDGAMTSRGYEFFRYADDMLVCTETEAQAHGAVAQIDEVLRNQLEMSLNPKKTVVCSLEQGVSFLGFDVSLAGLAIPTGRLDALVDRVRLLIEGIPPTDDQGAPAWEPALRHVLNMLNGFVSYYLSPGRHATVSSQLQTAFERVEHLVTSTLPPDAHQHPAWSLRRRPDVEEAEDGAEVEALAALVPECAYPNATTSTVEAPRAPSDSSGGRRVDIAPGSDGPSLAVRGKSRPADEEAPPIEVGGVLHLATARIALREDGDGIVVRTGKGQATRIDSGALSAVFLTGPKATISTGAARWLARHGVSVVVGSQHDTEILVLAVPSESSSRLRASQVLNGEALALRQAGVRMLQAKIGNQAATLRYYAKYKKRTGSAVHTDLTRLAAAMAEDRARLDSLDVSDWSSARKQAMGLEGHAAAAYWTGVRLIVPERFGFPGRRTRNAEDLVNQALNYAYGCLYVEVWRAVVARGLDPCLGIIHGTGDGAHSLVFDLIEEARAPFADRVVLSLVGRGFHPRLDEDSLLDGRSRRVLADAWHRTASRRVALRGKRLTLREILQTQAGSLRRLFASGHGTYHALHAAW